LTSRHASDGTLNLSLATGEDRMQTRGIPLSAFPRPFRPVLEHLPGASRRSYVNPNSSRRHVPCGIAAALALALACAPSLANRYKLIDLGANVYPRSINDRDEILASKRGHDGEYFYLLYRDGRWRKFDKADGDSIYPLALNQRGDIV